MYVISPHHIHSIKHDYEHLYTAATKPARNVSVSLRRLKARQVGRVFSTQTARRQKQEPEVGGSEEPATAACLCRLSLPPVAIACRSASRPCLHVEPRSSVKEICNKLAAFISWRYP